MAPTKGKKPKKEKVPAKGMWDVLGPVIRRPGQLKPPKQKPEVTVPCKIQIYYVRPLSGPESQLLNTRKHKITTEL